MRAYRMLEKSAIYQCAGASSPTMPPFSYPVADAAFACNHSIVIYR